MSLGERVTGSLPAKPSLNTGSSTDLLKLVLPKSWTTRQVTRGRAGLFGEKGTGTWKKHAAWLCIHWAPWTSPPLQLRRSIPWCCWGSRWSIEDAAGGSDPSVQADPAACEQMHPHPLGVHPGGIVAWHLKKAGVYFATSMCVLRKSTFTFR